MDFTESGLSRLFTSIHVAFGQCDNVFAIFRFAFAAGLNHGHPPLLLHVPQNQRASGKFSSHFGQRSIFPIMENDVEEAIFIDLLKPVLGRFEVTKVTRGCLVLKMKIE